LTVTAVYDRIKRSNSSLNRKSKRLLEDSIERVIAVVKEVARAGDDDEEDTDAEVGDEIEALDGFASAEEREGKEVCEPLPPLPPKSIAPKIPLPFSLSLCRENASGGTSQIKKEDNRLSSFSLPSIVIL
jgi:hypothetical protein